jgi:hypothetical protein
MLDPSTVKLMNIAVTEVLPSEFHSVRAAPFTRLSTPVGRVIDASPAIKSLATSGNFA